MARKRRRPCGRRCRPMPGTCTPAARPRSRPTRSASRSPEPTMTDPGLVPEHSVTAGIDEEQAAPRADLHDAIGWMAFGIAVLVGAITMDRLERQNINPVTVPGLLPGLLGIAMILLGAVMGLRSWRRGALTRAVQPRTLHQREETRRVAVAIALCLGYGVVLVGHGIPYWLASSIYVTV